MKNIRKKMEIFDKIKEFSLHDKDLGSSAVQIASLTYKIRNITDHKYENKKDKHCIVGLKKMIGKRSALLKYLKRTDNIKYNEVKEKLKI